MSCSCSDELKSSYVHSFPGCVCQQFDRIIESIYSVDCLYWGSVDETFSIILYEQLLDWTHHTSRFEVVELDTVSGWTQSITNGTQRLLDEVVCSKLICNVEYIWLLYKATLIILRSIVLQRMVIRYAVIIMAVFWVFCVRLQCIIYTRVSRREGVYSGGKMVDDYYILTLD